MSISEIVLIGIALSMDAFAVCVASSMVLYEYDMAEKTFNADYVRAFSGNNADFRVLSRKSFRIVY